MMDIKICGVCTKIIEFSTSYRKYERLESVLKTVIERKCRRVIKYICAKCKRRVQKAADSVKKGEHLVKVRTLCACTPRTKVICRTPSSTPRKYVAHKAHTPVRRRQVRPRRSSEKKKGIVRESQSQHVEFPSDSDVKVTVRQQNGQVRSLRIRNQSLQNICKAIGCGKSIEQVAKVVLSQDPVYRCVMELVLRHVNNDTKTLARTSNLSNTCPGDLTNIKFKDITDSWKANSSLFVPVISSLAGLDKDENVPADVVFGASTLLRHRNRKLSQLHHAVGLTLGHGGATDEVEQDHHASRAQSGRVVWSNKQMGAVIGNRIFVKPQVLQVQLPPPIMYSHLSMVDFTKTNILPEWPLCSSYATPRVGTVTVLSSYMSKTHHVNPQPIAPSIKYDLITSNLTNMLPERPPVKKTSHIHPHMLQEITPFHSSCYTIHRADSITVTAGSRKWEQSSQHSMPFDRR